MQALIFSVLGLLLTVITASQVSPSIINYIQSKKAESLVSKEQAVYDAINRYIAIEGTIPTSSGNDLVHLGYISSSVVSDNGWGNPITYSVDATTGVITIDTEIPNEAAKKAYLNSSKNFLKPVVDGDGSILSSFVIPQDILKGGLNGVASGATISSTAPNATTNKFWYDTSSGTAVLKISNGTDWVNIPNGSQGLPTVSSTNTVNDIASLPTTNVDEGDIRYVYNAGTSGVDTYVYYSTGWQKYLGGNTTPNTFYVKYFDTYNGRAWGDNTFAKTCNEYINPTATNHLYAGDTGNGSYVIDPDGNGGNDPFKAYCDMTTDGGGWTLVANSATTSTLYATKVDMTNTTNYNIASQLTIATTSKLVKLINSSGTITSLGTFNYYSSNEWRTSGGIRLLKDYAQYSITKPWATFSIPYSTANTALGAANHGSWCDSSSSMMTFMNPATDSTNGVHGGTQESQAGCNDNNAWKDNFSWQVYTK